jgi:hypothetical protein
VAIRWLQAAAEPVDGPRHDNIKPAPRGVGEQPVECRSLVAALDAADPCILIDLDNGPAGPLGDGDELGALRSMSRCRPRRLRPSAL